MHNQHSLKFDTRDMIALRQPHPAERRIDPKHREDAVERTGRLCRWGGVGILVGVSVSALGAGIMAVEHQVSWGGGALILIALSLFALIAVGSLVAAAGFNERNNQPLRAMTRLVVRQSSENTELLELALKKGDDTSEQLNDITARLMALEEIIERVPEYGEAVMDGIELGRGGNGDDDRV